MSNKLFRISVLLTIIAMVLAACTAPTPTPAPAPEQPTAIQAPTQAPAATVQPTASQAPATAAPAATESPTAVASMPFAHTACANGVDLTGKTVPFYHILDPNDQVDTVYNPLRAGYADAAEYFNAHGGICGATLKHVFDEAHWGNEQTIYDLYKALDPKPTVMMLYGSAMGVNLADKLAADQIPGLNIRGGSTASAYGEDGKTLGWVFATRPLYTDQEGAMCDYIAANPERFPHPVMGFLYFDVPWAETATLEARPYCTSLGIGDAGASIFSTDDTKTTIHSAVQKLVDAGATILYTNSHEDGPALLARTLFEMGLQDKVTLATLNVAMDPYVAFSGEADLGADGLPAINGMLGSQPTRSLAETDNLGIQLITAQADLHQRPLTMRTDGYIMGWDTTDLLIEVYIQTGNRVGFDHVTGDEIKKTLENIVYAPMGGVEQIDYQGGKRRALAADRIGEMDYLGKDGKTPAGTGNPPMVVTEGDQKHLVPMIVPLTGYQPVPDLRPGGADVPPASEITPTSASITAATSATKTPAPTAAVTSATRTPLPTASGVVLGTVQGRIAFQTNRDGNLEIYAMNGDGSGLTDLTNNPAGDGQPVWSPDGSKILFVSDRDGNDEIYVMNADGSDPTNLTNNPSQDDTADWSPDGKKIVFTTHRDGNAEIYMMNADGSGQTNLTHNPAPDAFPIWSRDGKQIGFTSDRDVKTNVPPGGNGTNIYLMNPDGSNQIRLTDKLPDAIFPRWSPDGKKILFTSGRGDGTYEIYVMNADGSNPVQLTDSPGSKDDNMDPRWSPDGTQIIFWSSRDGNKEIYVMNADGSNQTRLTNTSPSNSSWSSWH